MHRIDENGNDNGLFRRQNSSLNQQATVMGAAWPNAVQEEICHVIEGAGITLVKGENTQLMTALGVLIANLVPKYKVKRVNGAAVTAPSAFVDAPHIGSLISDGSINMFRIGTTGSYLFEMTVHAAANIAINTYLDYADDGAYFYLNGAIISSGTVDTSVNWPLVAGDNLIQIVLNNQNGVQQAISFLADFIGNGVTFKAT